MMPRYLIVLTKHCSTVLMFDLIVPMKGVPVGMLFTATHLMGVDI